MAITIPAFLGLILITFFLSPSLAQNESWINRIVTESFSLVESLQHPVVRSSFYIDGNDRVVFDLRNENGMPGIQLIVDKDGNASILDRHGRSFLQNIQGLPQGLPPIEEILTPYSTASDIQYLNNEVIRLKAKINETIKMVNLLYSRTQ